MRTSCALATTALSSREGGITKRTQWSGWSELEERNGLTNAVLRQHVTGSGLDDHVQLHDAGTGAKGTWSSRAGVTSDEPRSGRDHDGLGSPSHLPDPPARLCVVTLPDGDPLPDDHGDRLS